MLSCLKVMILDFIKVKIDVIIKGVLNFAQPPSLSSGEVEINTLLRENLKLWSDKFRKLSINMELSLGGGPAYIQCDSLGLTQVINNLFLNAAEAMEKGGVLSITTIKGKSTFHKNREVAIIKVKDSGAGIKPDQIGNIFNPFFTTKPTGTGLGLAIAHQIIERHGGAISAESERGKGITFTIELPFCGQ